MRKANKYLSCTALAFVVLGMALSGTALASDREGEIRAGGGINHNSASGISNEIGFQIYGGYNFGELFGVDDLDFLVEGGYWNSGMEFVECTPMGCTTQDVDGIWATGGVAFRFSDDISFLGRAGLDFGEDDGLMIGGGAAYHMTQELDLVGEVVLRDNVTSLQFNVTYGF